MGKKAGRILLALLGAAWGFAQIQHDVSVVNISVPVRVFEGEKFIDSLKLDDFEVFEDGKLQPIEAVYLIRGNDVRRQEGPAKAPAPTTDRTFVLLFQIAEYLPEIDKAVDLFFDSVYRPGDAVDFVTPQKTYRLRNRIDTPDKVRKAQYEVKSKLRNDILIISGAYRSVIEDMLADLGAGDPETAQVNLNGYRTDLERLEALRTIDSERLAAFAAELKGRPGAKHVFLFYQREKVPQFDNRKLNEFLNGAHGAEAALTVMELMSTYNREAKIDREAIQRAFSDASVDVHFLYVTRNRRDPQLDVENPAVLNGIQMAESSAAIFRVFKEIAAATGGTSQASANPAAMLRIAAAASEQYYLLYYRPQGYQADGKFHRITVKVKPGGMRVSHREGYFAVDVAAPVKAGSGPVAVSGEPAGKAASGNAGAKAGNEGGGEVEDIDITGTAPVKGAPVPEGILRAAAGYCRRLEDASLNFVSHEEVRERLSGALAAQASILKDTGPSGRGIVAQVGGVKDLAREWAYDYQLVRREGWATETRVLLEENGKARREENASLKTSRFEHKFVVLGPVGLFGEEAQRIHEYRMAGEADMEGEPVMVIDVRPTETGGSSLYGKAWVRERDGALLKIEWEPGSMGNYAAIEEFAKASRAQPRIKFTSEYSFEKNGLRFPSVYEVVEAYRMSGRTVTLSRTNVVYKDYKFFEVKVRTEVRRAG